MHWPEVDIPELSIRLPPTTSQFQLFPDFPTEIRLLIWHMATDEQRIVVIHSCGDIGGFRSATPQPVVLYVCQESRQVALLRYELTFSGCETHSFLMDCYPPKTYFNFERDTLYFRKAHKRVVPQSDEDEVTPARFGFHVNREQFDQIRSIGVDVGSSSATTSLSFLNYLNPRDLRTVYLCTEEGDLRAEQFFYFEPLKEKDYEKFVADTRTDSQRWFWPPEQEPEMRARDENDLIRSKGVGHFLKMQKSLQSGDTPEFRLVKGVNRDC